jgi:glycosyltransferase involved in cell wall biosynthesis
MISVILPTYNRAHTLKQAINSVTAQTYSEYELIIVDDGSSDGTQKLVEELHDPKCIFIRLENNSGQANARNEGIKVASGEYIAFIDSDDEWLPDKNEKQIEFLEKHNVDMVYSDVKAVLPNGESYIIKSPKSTRKTIISNDGFDYQGRNIFLQSCIIKASTLINFKLFDTDLRSLEDLDFFTRYLMVYNAKRFPEPVFIYHYDVSSSLSGNASKITGARLRMLEKYSKYVYGNPTFISKQYEYISIINTINRKYYQAIKYSLRGIITRPLHYRPWLVVFYSMFGNIYRRIINKRKFKP